MRFSLDSDLQEGAIMDRKAYEHLAELNRNVEDALTVFRNWLNIRN